MHVEAWAFLTDALDSLWERTDVAVVEFGSLNVNGSARELIPAAPQYHSTRWVGVDIEPGPGVDVVADAADWRTDERFDAAISAECFEHTPRWMEICKTAWTVLRSGGLFVVTAACEPREPHGAYRDDGMMRDGEFYENVDPPRLLWMLGLAFVDPMVRIDSSHGDVYATARRP